MSTILRQWCQPRVGRRIDEDDCPGINPLAETACRSTSPLCSLCAYWCRSRKSYLAARSRWPAGHCSMGGCRHGSLLLPRRWRCSAFCRHVLSTELADGTARQLCNAGAGEIELSGQRRRRRHGWCLQTAGADAGPTPLTMTQPRIDDIAVLDRGHQLKYS